jgi:butyrate kinase
MFMFWQTYLSEYLMDPIQSIVEGEKWSNHSVIASKSNQYRVGISSFIVHPHILNSRN